MSDRTPVAVASRSFSKHEILRKELLERYPNTTFNETGRSLKGAELVSLLKGCEKIVTALEVIDDRILSDLPDLKVLSKYGVGLDMLDMVALEKRGVLLGWTGGVNRRSVAELVVSAAIALLHRVTEGSAEVRSGKFRQIKGRQLTGRTVGIVGCGNVGKDLAVLLKAFGCRILVHDIRAFPDFYKQHDIEPVGLEELLERSEIVTLHLPLEESTEGIMNADRLDLMQKDAILINMARGKLVDEDKLKDMLRNGRLAGAALDVFNYEPPEDMELVNLPNLLPSPHIGGSTEEAILAMGRAAIDGLDNAESPSVILQRAYPWKYTS